MAEGFALLIAADIVPQAKKERPVFRFMLQMANDLWISDQLPDQLMAAAQA